MGCLNRHNHNTHNKVVNPYLIPTNRNVNRCLLIADSPSALILLKVDL
jgi:hypothetical protein